MYSKEFFMRPYVTFCDHDDLEQRYYLNYCKLKGSFELLKFGNLYAKITVCNFTLLPTGLFNFILFPKDPKKPIESKTLILNYADQNCVVDSTFRFDADLGIPFESAIAELRKRVIKQETFND